MGKIFRGLDFVWGISEIRKSGVFGFTDIGCSMEDVGSRERVR